MKRNLFGIIRHAHSKLVLVAALAAVTGCSRAPVITIKTQSSLTLSNVVVSGSGFSNRIANIPAGTEHRLTVRPSGDSGVRLVFDAGMQHIDSGNQGYFEARGADLREAPPAAWGTFYRYKRMIVLVSVE